MAISLTLLYDTASDGTRWEVKQRYSCERPTLMARAFAGEARFLHAGLSSSSNTTGHHRIRSGP
jgi:hypothetical protein